MNRIPGIAITLASLLAAGCAPVPEKEVAPVEQKPEPVPELTLNLPKPAESCVCQSEPEQDYTFLERGFGTLAAGNYIEAVQHFQRYARLEDSPTADWESRLAIAYISILPRSPFYDPEAAGALFRQLEQDRSAEIEPHTQILLMRESLESFVAMQRHIDDLHSSNSMLEEDLEKREQALKRLRELTLGQPVAEP
jgi:hypothetical protein